MIWNDKQVPLKNAPKLISKTKFEFLSHYDLGECLIHLQEEKTEKKQKSRYGAIEINEIEEKDSIIYFCVTYYGSQTSVSFVGKIEKDTSTDDVRVSGYMGKIILYLFVIIIIFSIVFLYIGVTFQPIALFLISIYLIVIIISSVLYGMYEQYLKKKLEAYLYSILGLDTGEIDKRSITQDQ